VTARLCRRAFYSRVRGHIWSPIVGVFSFKCYRILQICDGPNGIYGDRASGPYGPDSAMTPQNLMKARLDGNLIFLLQDLGNSHLCGFDVIASSQGVRFRSLRGDCHE
jgi:hypothetical protein